MQKATGKEPVAVVLIQIFLLQRDAVQVEVAVILAFLVHIIGVGHFDLHLASLQFDGELVVLLIFRLQHEVLGDFLVTNSNGDPGILIQKD